MNIETDLNKIADMVHYNAVDKGFHEEAIDVWWPKMLLNTITEITELWDADRAGKALQPCDKASAMVKLGLEPLNCMEEEYADLIIRALDQSRRLGIDIVKAINVKHEYNKTRSHKHGKKH